MRIKSRLIIAALINLFIILVVAFYSLNSTLNIQNSHKQLSQETLPIIRTLEKMQFGVLRIVSSTSEAGLLKYLESDATAGNVENELVEQGVSILKQAIKNYRLQVIQHFPEELVYLGPIESEANKLISISKAFSKALNTQPDRISLLELKEKLEQSEHRLLTLLEEVLTHESDEITERSLAVALDVDRHLIILVTGITLILIISFILSWHNSHKISVPLFKLQQATKKVSTGNLDNIGINNDNDNDNDKGEIGQLSNAFISMTKALNSQQKALIGAHQHTENILQVMEDFLIAMDFNGIINKVNRAVCDQLQFSEQELLGSDINQFLIQPGSPKSLNKLYEIIHGGNIECSLKNKAGNSVPVLISLSRINIEKEEASDFLLIATNISERKVAEEKIHKLAFYDVLTGLPNRTLFADRLKQALKVSDRHKSNLAVLFLDIDNFKQINDTLGHAVGDGMLREISEIITHAVRDSDVVSHDSNTQALPTISRHGGDEFLILLPDITDHNDIYQVTERILQQVSISILVEGHKIFCTVSIGIAIYPEHGENERVLIQNADTALYNAKAAGKNQYSLFEKHMNHSALRRMDIENNLRDALINNEFKLYFQPQFDLTTNQVIGMEALIRWHHPEWNVVSPLEFIPIAESNGLILPIGEWVLREACNQLKHWQSQGYHPGKMSINLSGSQFKNPDLCLSIESIIKETGVNAKDIVLEITESVLMQDAELTHNQLNFIKDSGIHLAVDDFGTGYSSLSYLKHFSLDFLKIDRSFVRDLESSQNDQEIVKTIINMARNLNLELVAEGVETQGQLRVLQAAGCHFIQGTLLSKPLIASDYEDTILKNSEALQTVNDY